LIAGVAGIQGIFWLTAVLAGTAILVVLFIVPKPKHLIVHRDAELVPAQLFDVVKKTELLRLDFGIFVLHVILTASFVIVPLLLRDAGLEVEKTLDVLSASFGNLDGGHYPFYHFG
jgi:hypothetical protein